MPVTKVAEILQRHVAELVERGTAKGSESVVTRVIPPFGDNGARFIIEGEGEKEFIRMNSNSYLGMSLRPRIVEAEEEAAKEFGAGPGAVRFISGTYTPHVELEKKLAEFHGREAAMIFSSAYATIISVITALTTNETMLISDELNHNCIINAMKLARPFGKAVYKHNDVAAFEAELQKTVGKAKRVLVITDGIFSMRGDHAPLKAIVDVAKRYDDKFEENVVVIVDDSHGVGAFGKTGRGTEEYTDAGKVDVLVGTLGKAFGVNGGYVTGAHAIISFLRETSPMYIYSNPITPAEAKAAGRALELLDSSEGRGLLDRLRALTKRFEDGLVRLGFEIIPGEHPVVPLMVRDTAKTRALVAHLRANGVLATGLAYPVVPRGDEEIRFQVNADHTESDIDSVLEVLSKFQG
ncbi:MAG TPA: aminotransferase class I/II-fold pyridoxal phosphate-dependent enzyme [Longimicrobiales bacterium]|nr:aminotransferase class I/II-fold pyridoxal phosphate-dependent enzyme [Longimicrobiales bacterium]